MASSEADDVGTALSHIILVGVAGRSFQRGSKSDFTRFGMHANFVVHGVIGFLHYQSKSLNTNVAPYYTISLFASRYLALPCFMADLYQGDKIVSMAHLVTGVIPFAMAVSGTDNKGLGLTMLACNILSLCYYANTRDSKNAWFAAGGAVVAYFVSSGVEKFPMIYPLGLSLLSYFASLCSFRSLDLP